MIKNSVIFKIQKIFLLSVVVCLSSCSGLKETLGLTREIPDEFEVSPHRSLEMPPIGSQSMQTAGKEKRFDVKRLVAKGGKPASDCQTKGEKALLSKLGVERDEDIRTTVNQESQKPLTASQKAKDMMMFWKKEKKKPAKIIDAESEKERLAKNGIPT